jgi:subtilisin family serine protease
MIKTSLLAIGLFVGLGVTVSYAQYEAPYSPPNNWFNLDATGNQVNGVSTEKAYEILKGKKSQTIVVAVIDSGIDINHEDLQDIVWVNEDEIAGNGIDDDKNGFIDDVHGWNFIGGKDGSNVGPDTYEVTREYMRLKGIYSGKKAAKKQGYDYWLEIEESYNESFNKANSQYLFYDSLRHSIERYNQLMTAYLDVEKLTIDHLQTVSTTDEQVAEGAAFMSNILQMIGDAELSVVTDELAEAVDHFGSQVKYGFNLDYNTRDIVGDDYSNLAEQGYGNPDVIGIGTDNFHGTHVAGIIAATRGNNIGIDGIADNVRIMPIRTVPDGDERDKDVANAIRYAVDNGAKVINMSFGKAYSPDKAYVDEAVQYASAKGVLLIHAAGNSGQNTDEEKNFPTRKLGNNKEAKNWIEVGASAWGNNEQLAAGFSNYGKTSVDVFAPGVQIYSTAPNNEYKNAQGTSMASPVTAGVAALLMSYYPHLTIIDVKEIIMSSSRKFNGLMVTKPGSKDEKVDFSELSVSGGIVNAFEAVKLAESRTISNQ